MYIFYEVQRIQTSFSIDLRKKSGAVTAINVRDNSFVDSLVQHDDGFHILKGLRSAPAHWEAEKKKVIAMTTLTYSCQRNGQRNNEIIIIPLHLLLYPLLVE